MSFTRLSSFFFSEASKNINYSPIPSVSPENKKDKKENKSEAEMYISSDVELGSFPNTPRSKVTTSRIDDSDNDDSEEYYDCVNVEESADDNNDEENDDHETYYDLLNNTEEKEEKEKSAKDEESLLEVFEILKELKIISDDSTINKPEAKEEISDDEHQVLLQGLAQCTNDFTIDEHQQLLQDLQDLGVFAEDQEDKNRDENLDDQPDNKTTSLLPSPNEILFYLSILAAAGVSIPTAIYALFLLSGMPIQEAGENLGAWWKSMSTAKKIWSIIFAFSSEYVNTKLNIKFFSEFWEKLTTNLKKCFTDVKSFFVSTVATILALGGAFAAGVLAYEGLIFSKILAPIFAALNSGLFFISRYIGVNRVFNRFINRKNNNIQRNIIDDINHLKEPFKVKLEAKLKEVVEELLRNKKPDEEKILTKSDFDIIFKALADELDKIKSGPDKKDCIKEKTRTEQAAEIGAKIFDNSLAAFIATITMITFAHKTKKGVEAMSDDLKDINNLLKILEGAPGGLASAMLFGVSAADFRTLCIEAAFHLYHHPKEIPFFLKDVALNVCATTSMYFVGTTIPGPDNEYNIPLNPATSLGFAIPNAIGAFFINFSATLQNYVEHPDSKKPTLDQVIHHFRNAHINSVPKEVISNLSMFKPKEVKVVKPITVLKPIYQDEEGHALPERASVAAAGGYRR
jgi:hypothetical protein